MKDIEVAGVNVERAVGFPLRAPVFPGVAAGVGVGRPLAASGCPAVMDRKLVVGVIRVELEGEADLALVAGALNPLGLDLRA